MKIRIEDSSIRFRLSKTDIKKLYKKGKVTCTCYFGSSSKFKYSIISKSSGNTDYLCVHLKENHVKVELSAKDVKEWYRSDLEGFDAEMDNGTKKGLYLLIEKDWECLSPKREEKDLFPNPKKTKH